MIDFDKIEESNITIKDLVEECDAAPFVVIGEAHRMEHKKYIFENIKELKKMGYTTAFVEYRPALASYIQAICKGYPYDFGVDTINYTIGSLAKERFKIVCADAEDVWVDNFSFRVGVNDVVRIKRNTHHYYETSVKDLAESLQSKEGYNVIANCIPLAYALGPKSLSNLLSEIGASPREKDLEAQDLLERQYIETNKTMRGIFCEMEAKRNEHIVEVIAKNTPRKGKAISLNGLSHVNMNVLNGRPDKTVQALLKSKTGNDVLSFGVYGGIENNFSIAKRMDYADKQELQSFFECNKYDVMQTDSCLLRPDLQQQAFFVSNYEDNDGAVEDFQIHLPEKISVKPIITL